MKFPVVSLSIMPKKRSDATNPQPKNQNWGFFNDRDCIPKQIREFDASYHEVKEISITLYAHFMGCSLDLFLDWDIDQLTEFFGRVGADEGRRDFGLIQLGMWRAMRTGQGPTEASLIVHEKMCIGKEFLGAGGVRSIMWWEESLWYDSCFKTKGCSSTMPLFNLSD